MKKIFIFYSLIILTVFGFIYGCSEVKDNVVMAPTTSFHGEGWLNPASTNFHGKTIAADNWNPGMCKSCHGADYNGGTAQVSCLTCHENGPESCNTCHGNDNHIYPPKSLFGNTLNTQTGVGAHDKHMNSDTTQRFTAVVECEECHLPVSSFSDPNHIANTNSTATLVFGNLAKTVTEGVTPNPTWDKGTQTCSGTYCHGNFKNGNTTNTANFITPNSAGCGTCHGNPTTGNPLPGGTHPQGWTLNKCYLCHGAVINSAGVIINQSRHVNGAVDFGVNN
ncbi:MAG: hypothetical protein LWX07_07215 [Bacteroidetes bacterium]|nr:hypothetical protein [Bacteroidota bacterium]